jgi:hypothetical protein
MTKTWFVDGQIIEEPIPEAEMNTNFSGNLHEVMHQAAWDSATRVPEGDIRALKHRIHELEGEVIGYKQILDTQPEPAECDGGQCGIGGYCKQCPKTQPEPDYEAEFIKDWNEGKVRRVSDGKRMVPEREWVGLTDDERKEIALEVPMDAVCITEAKLKKKNT